MKTEVRRLSKDALDKDQYTFNAVQSVENYHPVKEEVSVENLLVLNQKLAQLGQLEVKKEGEYKAARDNAIQAEHEFHNAMLEVKNQVRAQFGDDSNELQSLGLKKKSEYKAPKKKTKKEIED